MNDKRVNKSGFRKDKLNKLGFDSDRSEHDIMFDNMISRFMRSDFAISLQLKEEYFKKYMSNEFKKYNYHCVVKDESEYEIDIILGKQIMNHLKDFFLISSKNNTTYFNKTQKNNIFHNKSNKSRKNR